MSKENPSYYSILTADVRYDRKLSANQKILFSEITCLTNKYGYCKASNSYFSRLYDVAPETVSRWISKLKKSGYIKVKIIYEKGTKQIAERRIYLLTKTSIPIDDNVNTPIDKIINTPIDKNVKDNSTSINNTSINIKESKPKKKRFVKPTAEQVNNYLKENNNDNKIDADYFIDYYESKDWMVGKARMKDWKATVRNWLRRNKQSGANNGNNRNKKETPGERKNRLFRELREEQGYS